MHARTALSYSRSENILKVIGFLDSCKPIAEDEFLHSQALQLVEAYESEQAETEQLLRSLISLILTSFSIHVNAGSSINDQIKLLQSNLISPVTPEQRLALQHCVESFADSITLLDSISPEEISIALEPLLQSFGLLSMDINTVESISTQVDLEEHSIISKIDSQETNAGVSNNLGKSENSLKQFISANHLSESIAKSEEFAVMLEVELASLKSIDNDLEFEEKKSAVLKELEKVLRGHQKMARNLQELSGFVHSIQEDTLRLNDELDRVTLLSLTDELTQLPNRRAFLRRLKYEIGRVKRYGHNLTVALIDIDYFKSINDNFGHNSGDIVLKTYARKILSSFRQPDLVARYGGEEFAVIFPNTNIDGALQALQKVQQRANEFRLELNGQSKALPTFSAGIASYGDDEGIQDFIERVDKSLYEAKNKGRNRIEIDNALFEEV